MDINKKALRGHRKLRGKISVECTHPMKKLSDLDWLYTPGVAEPCRKIAQDPSAVHDYTSKWNNVAIVTDGSRVLGLGNIGAEAAIPVMEGKSMFFGHYAGVSAWPVCVRSQKFEEIVDTVCNIEPMFGGINLEDIETPKCFEIEAELKRCLSIPVFHDDQHGTAIVTLAALVNALELVQKELSKVKIVIAGAGAAGIGVGRLLIAGGAQNIVMVDSCGIVHPHRKGLNAYKKEIVVQSRAKPDQGSLQDALKGADVFVGLSGIKDLVSRKDIELMSRDAIVFAQTNPDPDILPDEALAGGAEVVATGRSDFPNQVNNALVFPGVFRGAFDNRVSDITPRMMVRVAFALAGLVTRDDLSPEYVIPRVTDRGVVDAVAGAIR